MNKNQKNFPSTAQKSIWHVLQFMSPFYEITPPHIADNMIKHYIEGEKEFYQFMNNLYSDMYNNPETYYIHTIDFDTYMKGRKREELPHKNDSRESALRNKFQHSIKFYQDFFYEIGRNGDLNVDSQNLIIPENKFSAIIRRLNVHKKGKEIFNCIDALKAIGFNNKKKATTSFSLIHTIQRCFLALRPC